MTKKKKENKRKQLFIQEFSTQILIICYRLLNHSRTYLIISRQDCKI